MDYIQKIKDFRVQVDACIQTAENDFGSDESGRPKYKREMALARTKLQEAKMWLGKCLEAIGSELPEEYRDKAE